MNDILKQIQTKGLKQKVMAVIDRNSHKGNKLKGYKVCFRPEDLYILYYMYHNASEVQEEFLLGISALVEDKNLTEVTVKSINGEKEFTYFCRDEIV